ncbi:hypothetical protein [Metabacillus fastidiosus]|uniref:hypothetical protein n=1 Tax=Metabacillus fastidiosus TaxID=1458 RepID=UPI002E2368B2|nr:hypothetical protein [Metabacillus fastidiosus]
MLNQIRKIIEKIKGEDIFCSVKDEEFILKVLEKKKKKITPFNFKQTDKKGIELLEFVLSLTKEAIILYNKNIPKNKKKKIFFFFVDDMEINAFATIIKNIDVIGINVGILNTLYDYYDKVVDENIFPEVGSDVEERKNLIFRLQVMSILYIICHELGHLYNGHIGFNKVNFMKEIRKFNGREKIIYNKTIEMDADAFAMNRMLEFNENLIGVKSKDLNKTYNYDSIEYSYKILMFSMYSFYLFFQETFEASDIENDTYFSPVVRQLLNLTISEEFVNRTRPQFESKIKEITDYLMMHADFTLDRYYSNEKSDEEKAKYLIKKLQYFQSNELKEEMLEVKKEWNEIRDELQKNARFNLAPKYELK